MQLQLTNDERNNIDKVISFFNREKTSEEIFYELCFAICSPLSRNKKNCAAIRRLIAIDFYGLNYDVIGDKAFYKQLLSALTDVIARTYKAKYLLGVKRYFNEIIIMVTSTKDRLNSQALRQWLVKNVHGLGLCSASSFLQFIGRDDVIAINYDVVDFFKKNFIDYQNIINYDYNDVHISHNAYLIMEEIIFDIAKENNLSAVELNLLIWNRYAGKKLDRFYIQ